MKPTPAEIIFNYVLERMQSEPIDKRIQLLRSLAYYSADKSEMASLVKMANALEEVQRSHRQLLLNLQQVRS